MATPLAVTLAELLQNAVEHAFGHDPDGDDAEAVRARGAEGSGAASVGHVAISSSDRGTELSVVVRDDGCGLPKGFDIERTTSLGLSIVRDLVMSQLGGSITMERVPPEEGGGTRVSHRRCPDGPAGR